MVSFTTFSMAAVVACMAMMQPCTAPPALGVVARVGASVVGAAISNHHKRTLDEAFAKYPVCGTEIKSGKAKVQLHGNTVDIGPVSPPCLTEMKNYKSSATAADKEHGRVVIETGKFKMVNLTPQIIEYLGQAKVGPAKAKTGGKAKAPGAPKN